MKNRYSFLFYGWIMLCLSIRSWAGPAQTTPYIKIDQFGYFPTAKKVAVIVDPQSGYNAAESFNPGTGANQYQVRRWSDDAVVLSGTLQAWNGGATHGQSGDKGWWFDFSALTTAGSYYIFDVQNNVGSYRFDIGDTVYDEAMKHAMRSFYYQRLNFAKQAPYTDHKWADGASYEGANQDRFATSRFSKGNAATAKDLHGGWMDAGDVNKYTTFAESAVIQLAEAYRINPNAFKDNYNIPESGNGIPDILDELKYELDFLKRMQDGTGTNGFFLKMGVDNYNEVSPISTDTRPRYYLPECTSATLAGAAMFAVAGQTFKTHASLLSYGNDLIVRAEAAWNRTKITTNNFTTFETNNDDGDIKSGDADRTAEEQLGSAFVTAVYLYEATGKAEYKTFVESQYVNVKPFKDTWWGPYWIPQQLAFLRYTTLSGVSATVANNIRNQKAGMNYLMSVTDYSAATDLYRAYMPDSQHHWGSNQVRSNGGALNLDFITFNINPASQTQYREVAEQYLHWMNGVNPMNLVMLSNMSVAGAENSVNEIYHTWFTNGTVWDNVLTSANGPAPGYVTGGPNKSYGGSVANITNQPPQKAYKEWNNGSPENSWEITEPSIYNQAAYIMLLGRLMNTTTPPTDNEAPTAPTNLTASNVAETSLTLTWTASTDNVGVTAYEVYQGANLLNGNVIGTSFNVSGLACNTAYSFTVKAKDAAGNVSDPSNAANTTTTACDVQAPTVPSNVTASNVSSSSLTLSWTASTDNVGVMAYEVYQGATLVNGNVTGTSLNITGLACNSPFSFTVKAKDAAGNTSANSSALNVSTSACSTGIIVYDDALAGGWDDWSWGSTRNYVNTSPVQVGVNSIRVDYSGWGGVSLRQATAITPTANTEVKFWVYSTAANSLRFYIQTDDSSAQPAEYAFTTDANQWKEITVNMSQMGSPAAIKRINFQNGSANNVTAYFDQIRIDSNTPPTDTQAPSVPTGLTASNITQTSLTLSWTASTDNVAVTAYEVYRGTTLLSGSVSGTSYNVTGLTCGTAYSFTVKAKDAAGNISAASNALNTNTLTCPDTQAPSKPVGLAASNKTQSSLTLTWTASTDNIGVVAYEVYQGGVLLNGNVTTTSLNISGLICNTTYTYNVKAKDAAGNVSAISNTLSVKTTACLSLVIYDEALDANWSDWSWGSTRNFANTTPVKVGGKSLRTDYTGWGGISFQHGTGITPTASTILRFWVRSTAANSLRVSIQTSDSGTELGNYTFTTGVNAWQEIVLNMSQLGNPTLIKRINIQNNSANNVTAYFDNIRINTVNNARLGTEAIDENEEMLAYPNPSEGMVNVHYFAKKAQDINLQVIDMSGTMLQHHVQQAAEGINTFQVNLNHQSAGLYLIRVQSQEGTQTKKVLIQR